MASNLASNSESRWAPSGMGRFGGVRSPSHGTLGRQASAEPGDPSIGRSPTYIRLFGSGTQERRAMAQSEGPEYE